MRKPLLLLCALALALPGPIPVQANEVDQVSRPGARPHRVTLITGDVVTFFDDNRFTVEPAARPDGRPVTFTGRTGKTIAQTRDFYVVPSDVEGDARLDPELFNVKGLVQEGVTTRTPVIVKGGGPAYRAAKVDGAAFWRGLAKDAKVWLDHRRAVRLDRSVLQIGAPVAWAGGHTGAGVTVAVIDTGIDATHPDLADRVVAAHNFTEDPDAGDYHGHGTHVASAIAGRQGVAPGAKLVNAKGCDGGGYCYDSWLMAAMEFAAHSGARVVNMSVGGGVSDGQDPISLELNRLTEETGVLFVVAAGNDGESGNVTVGSPGAAAAALTVGAVDRADGLASFSSRGPRFGDAGVKPELTAPGVGIVAARASGTSMGTPIDELYTAASGTSMATPHTAGAAAILAGQHGDWKAGRIKDALVSTAKPVGHRVIDGGAGRVDLARTHTVTASATVDFGRIGRRAVVVRRITYHNDGDRGALLRLQAVGHGWNGLAWNGVVAPVVFVPARGTAHTHVLVTTFTGDAGSYSGVVTASGDGVSLRTPVSYYVVPPVHRLDVRVLGHDGTVVDRHPYVLRDDFDPERNNDPFAQLTFAPGPVPTGSYTVMATIYESELTSPARWTALSKVDVAVRRDVEVTLDARQARPLDVDGGSDVEPLVRNVSFGREVRGGAGVVTGCSCRGVQAFATPTPAPRFGTLSLQDTWTFGERWTRVSAGGSGLDPVHDRYQLASAFPGTGNRPVVWAGDGQDFSGVDVAGKVALVGLSVPANSADPSSDAYAASGMAAEKAAAAGASAVVAFVDVAGARAVAYPRSAIPYLALSQAEGLMVRAAGSIDIETKSHPAYLYNLHYSAPNGIGEHNRHVVDRGSLVRVESEYHADKPGFRMMRAWTGFRREAPGMMVNPAVYLPARTRVTEYAGGSADAITGVDWTRIGVIDDGNRHQITMYNRRPLAEKDVWFEGPSSPGGFDPGYRSFYRLNWPGQQQFLYPSGFMGDGAHGHQLDTDSHGYRATRYRLWKDGIEIPPIHSPYSGIPYFSVPDEPALYRLDAETILPRSGLGGPTLDTRTLSPRVDTSWTFRSERGRPEPCFGGAAYECKDESLLQLFYELGLDLDNTARGGVAHEVGVSVRRTDGGSVSLAGLSLAYSADEGVSWHAAGVVNGRATVVNPAGGHVWLRVEAWTESGERVLQTVQRAYAVS